jgi:hypothetical protein
MDPGSGSGTADPGRDTPAGARGPAGRGSEVELYNGILRATSQVTEGLVGTLKDASDHIANRVYRDKFVHGITEDVDKKCEADIHSSGQFGKDGFDRTDAAGAALNRTGGSAEDHMKAYPDGGIWLGDSRVHDLGHTAWAATRRRDQQPGGWPDGTTWDDVGGLYSDSFRALLVGHTQHSRKATAPHEFGHAFDDALGRPSKQIVFSQFHTKVLRHIQATSPNSAEYFAQSGEAGKRELFAEGIAWRNRTLQDQPDGINSTAQPEFYGSVAAGRHLTAFYQALERELGITA